MKNLRGRIVMFAVVFSAVLVISKGAEASGLFALNSIRATEPAAERQIGLLDQAVAWLSGAWTDLKMVFGQDEPAAPAPPACTDPSGCTDAGPGIDPIG